MTSAMLHLRARTLDDTCSIAAALAGVARVGDLIVLAGEMGSGKTAFAKGFAAALGVTEPVTSPTYTLVHSYDAGRVTLHHADIYRLSTQNEVADLALSELCHRYQVSRLELFGSSARGEHRADSDVDLLVAFQPEAEVGFLHLARLQTALEDLLGQRVDLVPRRGLKSSIRDEVLSEARLLSAA